ncbi:MAG: FkbM family methyltransferase [Flavobacteriales bacterium]|nr:FkbM family methyltransferase [Flavobacteriales bacterium]
MSEKLTKSIASLFRKTPHFKGKFRIAKSIQNILMGKKDWTEPEFFIRLKNKTSLYIDVRSKTHLVPFWIGKRDQEIISKMIKHATEGAVILDVGANIGYYALPIAYHLRGKKVSVHAFEPVTSNYESLMKGIHKNQVSDFVVANKIALGDKAGSIDIIKTEKGNSGNAVLSINNDDFKVDRERETIEMITFDSYADTNALNRCDFIKIDIEGAEIFFIQGSMKAIKQFQPLIFGEFNSYFISKFGFTILDVWNLLEPLGYSAYLEDHNRPATFRKVNLKEGMENVLFVPQGKEVSLWTA